MRLYTSKNFRVEVRQLSEKVLLTQQILDGRTSTSDLPVTYQILKENIPTVFDNECFNTEDLPFEIEVRKTEVGHLLEHLILENLKIESWRMSQPADFVGQTTWNWYREKYGKFNIEIWLDFKSRRFFKRAFRKSIFLLEKIYRSQKDV